MSNLKGVSVVQNNGKTTYINLPKVIAEKLEICKGDRVYIEAKEDGTLIIKK